MDIMRDGVVDSIKRIVNRYHVDYRLLEFELTGDGVFQNFNTAAHVMKELQDLGFSPQWMILKRVQRNEYAG